MARRRLPRQARPRAVTPESSGPRHACTSHIRRTSGSCAVPSHPGSRQNTPAIPHILDSAPRAQSPGPTFEMLWGLYAQQREHGRREVHDMAVVRNRGRRPGTPAGHEGRCAVVPGIVRRDLVSRSAIDHAPGPRDSTSPRVRAPASQVTLRSGRWGRSGPGKTWSSLKTRSADRRPLAGTVNSPTRSSIRASRSPTASGATLPRGSRPRQIQPDVGLIRVRNAERLGALPVDRRVDPLHAQPVVHAARQAAGHRLAEAQRNGLADGRSHPALLCGRGTRAAAEPTPAP